MEDNNDFFRRIIGLCESDVQQEPAPALPQGDIKLDFIKYLLGVGQQERQAPEAIIAALPKVEIAFDDFEDEEQNNFADDGECDNDPEDNPMDRDDVFVPPLQAKLELMKKMAGIPVKNQELMTSAADDDGPFEE